MRKPCCDKEGTNKGAWSKQEDQKLIEYIRAHGEGCWRSLPKAAGLQRCGKSCRLRWINYLRPDIKRGNFAQDEEDLIIKLHALLGNRWSLIAGRLPGRTDNEVKNYWNSHIRRKLINMGIDPNSHKLHQSFPVSAPSPAGSMNKELDLEEHNKVPLIKSCGAISDTHSCIEEEAAAMFSSSSHHLNLDLTIAFPNSLRPALMVMREDKKNEPTSDSAETGNDMDNDETSPKNTLLLFR